MDDFSLTNCTYYHQVEKEENALRATAAAVSVSLVSPAARERSRCQEREPGSGGEFCLTSSRRRTGSETSVFRAVCPRAETARLGGRQRATGFCTVSPLAAVSLSLRDTEQPRGSVTPAPLPPRGSSPSLKQALCALRAALALSRVTGDRSLSLPQPAWPPSCSSSL